MISTENLTSSTVFTVSDTPSSVTEPFAAMKRASSRVVRSSNRAMSGRSSRVTMVAMPSAWPATMWPPSSSPIFSARSRLSLVPTRQCFAVVMASVSAAASTSNQVLSCATPDATTVRQTPLQAIDAPSAIVA